MLVFSVLLICAFYLLYLYFQYKTPGSDKVAVFPGKWPNIGYSYFYATVKDIFDIIEETGRYAVANGDVCKFYFIAHPGYVITDPEDASTVMNKCLKKMFLYKLINPLFGSELSTADVAVWKRNRRIVDMAFKPHLLDTYIEYFNSQAKQLVHQFAKEVGKGDIDLTNIVIRNIFQTTCHTTMGNCNDVSGIVEEYVKAMHTVLNMISYRILRPWLLIDFIFNRTSDGRQFNNALNTVFQYNRRMVELRKAELINRLKTTDYSETMGIKFKSYLDILLETSAGPNGFLFTDEEYIHLVNNVLLAAYDTTAYELIFILVCIGTYPDIQEKIYEEIINVLGDEENVTKDHLQRFVYLEAAIKEALRLYPIGPVIARQTDTDIKLNNITVPGGSSIFINVYAINRHKKHWGPDAEDYRPDRWLDSATPAHPAAYCSFAPGKRGCAGKYYTMIHLKSTLIPILRKFKLTADHKKMKLNWCIMIKPLSGHLIKLDLR